MLSAKGNMFALRHRRRRRRHHRKHRRNHHRQQHSKQPQETAQPASSTASSHTVAGWRSARSGSRHTHTGQHRHLFVSRLGYDRSLYKRFCLEKDYAPIHRRVLPEAKENHLIIGLSWYLDTTCIRFTKVQTPPRPASSLLRPFGYDGG